MWQPKGDTQNVATNGNGAIYKWSFYGIFIFFDINRLWSWWNKCEGTIPESITGGTSNPQNSDFVDGKEDFLPNGSKYEDECTHVIECLIDSSDYKNPGQIIEDNDNLSTSDFIEQNKDKIVGVK